MAKLDPEQERQRLVQFYSQQLDGELEKVAKQGYELTEEARSALKAELARRGLEIEIVESAPETFKPAPGSMPGDPPPEMPEEPVIEGGELEYRKLVSVRSYRDLPEALLARAALESAGIHSSLIGGNVVRLNWFWSNLAGGVTLQVAPEDVDAALEILSQPIPEQLEVPGIGEYQQPRCPKCGSLDVAFKELDKAIAYTTAYFSVPVPWHRRAWRCHSCKSEWEDDSDSEP